VALNVAVGFSALMAAASVGHRKRPGLGKHNLPAAALGALLLFVGWFGITTGYAVLSGASVAAAAIATHVCFYGSANSHCSPQGACSHKKTPLHFRALQAYGCLQHQGSSCFEFLFFLFFSWENIGAVHS
jgi:ammonia channel protein AmtB